MVPSAHQSEVGPTVRGREVGARLRQLRCGLDLTTEAVASKLLCSATKILRIETGDPALRDVVFVEGLYSNQYQEKDAELERYREAIEYLRDESMSPKDSLTLIADIRKTYAT